MDIKFTNKQSFFNILPAVLLVIFSIILNQLQILQRWDNLVYDLESTAISKPINDNIVIVAIDDISLEKLGRWPWPRVFHARLLNQLTAAGVTAIGMDILFMEADLIDSENDRQLAIAIRQNGHVVLPVLTHIDNDRIDVTKPISELADVAHLAHVNMLFDKQGVVRQLKLQLELNNNQFLPAMSLALSRQLAGHIEPTDVANRKSSLIAFAGADAPFHYLSYSDVLLNAEVGRNLKGKVVLIGMTAAGLGSTIATPVSNTHQLMPGIEFHANALASIQSRHIIRLLELPSCILISMLLIVIPVMLYRLLNPGLALMLVLFFCALTVLTSYYLLSILQLWFAPLSTLLCLLLSYPLWSLHKLKQLGRSLFREHEKSTATLLAIEEAVITTDNEGYIEFMNPAAEKMLACSLVEARNKFFSEVCQRVDKNDSVLLARYTLTTGEQATDTHIIRNQHNKEYAVRISSSPIHSENGLTAGIVYAISDLTEMVYINQKIAYIAAHDTLTGLPNRVLLQDRLQQTINIASRKKMNFAVLFIDLDDFKKINDAMGHISGDLLLKEVALRLKNCIRQSDTISRWGGDEFIILVDNLIFPTDAADIALKIRQSLAQLFIINKQKLFVTPSIGISLFPEDGLSAEVLLAKADTAMYSVKKGGRNDFSFYSQNLDLQSKEKLILETELRQALEADEFEMHYQLQVDLSSNFLIGTEALIRWRHPKKGLIAPGNFIPLAEEIGLIVAIGEWVIKTVCQQIKSWQEQGLPAIKVAINLSAHQFAQKNLISIITQEIKNYSVKPDSLQVEITESMMIQDIDRVVQVLDELKSAGISIAIDDFGTGYSSLEYLKRFPIDKLKIDRSFINNVINNADDASIVQAVIALGHNMSMQIIAEGVETKEQVKFLRDHNCDYGQGYFYSRPIPVQKMTQLIKEFKRLGNI